MLQVAGFRSQGMSHILIANKLVAKSAGQLGAHINALPWRKYRVIVVETMHSLVALV